MAQHAVFLFLHGVLLYRVQQRPRVRLTRALLHKLMVAPARRERRVTYVVWLWFLSATACRLLAEVVMISLLYVAFDAQPCPRHNV